MTDSTGRRHSELGYAEADPAADVDGLDAADKIAILAALAFGGPVDRETAIPTDGISANCRDVDVDYAQSARLCRQAARGCGTDARCWAWRDSAPLALRVQPTLVPSRSIPSLVSMALTTPFLLRENPSEG